jgi:hypothetical protein
MIRRRHIGIKTKQVLNKSEQYLQMYDFIYNELFYHHFFCICHFAVYDK